MSTQEPNDSTEESADDEPQGDSPEANGNFSAIIDTDALAVVLDALDAANAEAVWEIDAAGLEALNVDPATVTMCEVSAPQDAFESFDPAPVDIGIRLPTFRNAALAGDLTSVELDAESRKIHVESGPLDAKLSPLDPDSVRTQRVPDDVIDGTDATWTMPYETFNDAITHVSKFGGNTLQLHVGDGFHGFRKLGDIDDVDVEFEADAVEWDEQTDDRQIVLLSQDYLKEIRKAIPKDTDVTISASTEWPLIIEYSSHGVDVRFVVAPRIEGD